MLEDYVQKRRPSRKSKSKLVKVILTNQEAIQNMNIYHDQKTQTEKERDSIENSSASLQDNSSTNNLYPLGHWEMEWNEKGENLISENDYYILNDLYIIGDYNNVLRSDHEG